MKHLAVYDGDHKLTAFVQVERFNLTAIDSMPDRYLFTAYVGDVEVINSMFVNEIRDLSADQDLDLKSLATKIIVGDRVFSCSYSPM